MPDCPQSCAVCSVVPRSAPGRAELLAPAGTREAAYAAFRFGADAVYLGMKKFSARAEAMNFTFPELEELLAFAHVQTPRRRVFVTLNTVVQQAEVPDLIDLVVQLAEAGVDALIVQDLGLAKIAREAFPGLELHASTQMAIHNLEGAQLLRRLGFSRVTLARELTLEEIQAISAGSGVETEVFIHGALCYSYSGLCLISSHLSARSGNRGRCGYPCRDRFTVGEGAACSGLAQAEGFAFSMKDLAATDKVLALRPAGVSCFKIEGRMKSPLYVGAVTDYYRRLLDGGLKDAAARQRAESDIQTVFSRPWTPLYLNSRRQRLVIDPEIVGHRGGLIGTVETVSRLPGQAAAIRFRTNRSLERHDGVQIDLPGNDRPYGFAVDLFRVLTGGSGDRFAIPAGAQVELQLPADAPVIPVRTSIYCASSQAVKRAFALTPPKPGEYRREIPLTVRATLAADTLTVHGLLAAVGTEEPIAAVVELAGPFSEARDPARVLAAFQEAFSRFGDTRFGVAELVLENPAARFVPASQWNAVRRQLAEALELRWGERLAERVATLRAAHIPTEFDAVPEPSPFVAWTLGIEAVEALGALEPSDWLAVDEVLFFLRVDQEEKTLKDGTELLTRFGPDSVRFALPAVMRGWEREATGRLLAELVRRGVNRWSVANLAGWQLLSNAYGGRLPDPPECDLWADWPIPLFNRDAARQLQELGATGFTLSPEDSAANMQRLLAEFADRATVIVYQDTPLFISESCPAAALNRGCLGAACGGHTKFTLTSTIRDEFLVCQRNCRTFVVQAKPFCLTGHLRELKQAGARRLRADFAYRDYSPEQLRDLWRKIIRGEPIPNTHDGNFVRGLL